jgi:hypothetical protein
MSDGHILEYGIKEQVVENLYDDCQLSKIKDVECREDVIICESRQNQTNNDAHNVREECHDMVFFVPRFQCFGVDDTFECAEDADQIHNQCRIQNREIVFDSIETGYVAEVHYICTYDIPLS